MESKITSSFIPDKMPGAPVKRNAASRVAGSSADIFVVVAIVIFAASLALGAGVFLYDKYITTSAKAKSEQLQRERKLLEPATVRELMRLDKRLSAAAMVLNSHVAPSALFDLLEKLTLKSVYFENFEYTAGGVDGAVITMVGKASTVNGVALQADIFGKSRAIINPIFSNLNLVSDGVEFDVTTTISRDAIEYAAVSTYEDYGDNSNTNNF